MTLNDIARMYDQPWRHHHTWRHVSYMTHKILGLPMDFDKEPLFIAARFHDAVYEPFASDNEEKSNELWREYASENKFDGKLVDEVSSLILSTKHPENCKTPLEIAFRDADWHDMGNVHEIDDDYAHWLEEYENNIFREFQKVPVGEYVKGRLAFIDRSVEDGLMTQEVANYLRPLVRRKRRVGIYAGSFLPFHKGHLSILQNAEKMFDKVIVAKKNLDRTGVDNVRDILRHHQVDFYDGQLVDYIGSQWNRYCEPALVRGLRNGYDLMQEVVLARFLSEQAFARGYKPVPIVHIPCDREYEHISSSALRSLGADDAAMYIPQPR